MTAILFVLAGTAGLFFAVDVWERHRFGLVRTAGQWCLLFALGALCAAGAAGGFVRLGAGQGTKTADVYLAYRYLQDDDAAAAKAKAASCEKDSGLITLLADALDRDYLSAYFGSDRLLREGKLNGTDATLVRGLKALSAGALGLNAQAQTGEVTPVLGAQLQSECAAEGGMTMTEDERHTAVQTVIREAADSRQGLGSDRLDDLYTLDRAMMTEDVSSLDESDLERLQNTYPNDKEVLLLSVKYYARIGDYTRARSAAQQLLEKDASAENYVVYTDLIAQQVQDTGMGSDQTDDPEAQSLLKQAEALEEKADAVDTSAASGTERCDELRNRAQDLRTRAARLDVARSVNYLLAKKPLFGDTTGLLDLQIAKLYVALDERENAKTYIWKVVDGAGRLEASSPILKPLEEVTAAYSQLGPKTDSSMLTGAVRSLVSAQSGGVIPAKNGSVNDTLASYVTSTLKYDRLMVFIGRIDTSSYPTVRAYVNVSGEKSSVFGAAGDFAKKDFQLVDTQYEIPDFRLVNDAQSKNVSIALVVDTSGSMDGAPLADAKLAAQACVDKMDTGTQRMALIRYNDAAGVEVGLTNAGATLVSHIRGLSANGGTYISGGIQEGLGALSGAAGTRAIILLTDGQDNDTSEIEATLQEAQKAGVAIFTVGLGDVNTDYLQHIADATGGRFIAAASSTELSDIYLLLQKYIVNNYCFEYTVTGNPETDPRSLTVEIPSYSAEDTKAYRISGEEVEEEDAEVGIQPVDENTLAVYSMSPAGASVGDAAKGISVTVKGSGFQDGMNLSVGSLTLTGLKIKGPGEATGTLKGTLTPNGYAVQARTKDGRVASLKNGFRVFRAGTVGSVRIGDLTILADSIGAIDEEKDGYVYKLAASGNVSLNGFLHSTGELQIDAPQGVKADSLGGGSVCVYLGANGTVSGNGKLYVSYAQTQATASQAGGLTEDIFTKAILGGRDLVVRSGEYVLTVASGSSALGAEYQYAIQEDMADFAIDLPGFTKISAATASLYPDRLQLDAKLLDLNDIEDNLISVFTGGVKGTKKDRDALRKAWGGKWGDGKGNSKQGRPGIKSYSFDGGLSVAVGADTVTLGGEVTLKLKSTPKFFLFPIRSFGLKLNTLDAQKEYWSGSVGIGLPGAVKLPKGPKEETTLTVKVGSYYWYPDSLTIDAGFDPGIPILKVMSLTKVGLGYAGGSCFWMDSAAAAKKDTSITATAEATLNLFQILNLPKTGAARSLSRWGELGKISDAKAVLNVTDNWAILISADLELLQQKVASAQISWNDGQFSIHGGLDANLNAASIELGGKLTLNVDARLDSLVMGIVGEGKLKCSWAKLDSSGTIGAEFSTSSNASGTVVAVKVTADDKWARAWFDSSSGSWLLLDKFHWESGS